MTFPPAEQSFPDPTAAPVPPSTPPPPPAPPTESTPDDSSEPARGAGPDLGSRYEAPETPRPRARVEAVPLPRPRGSRGASAPLIIALVLGGIVCAALVAGIALVATSSGSRGGDTSDQPSGRIAAADYDHDWHFKLGDVKLDAKHLKGWNFGRCGFARTKKLSTMGCRYGVEVSYSAEDGNLKLTNLFMAMPDKRAAKRVTDRLTGSDFAVEKLGRLPKPAFQGWVADAEKQIAVVTVVTATKDVDEATAKKYAHYMNADQVAALIWR